MNEDATARRQQLGRLLRRAREAAELTQTYVAGKLGCGQAKITKIETTLVGISLPELAILIDLYELPAHEAAELRRLTELDQQNGPARTKHSTSPAAFGELTELEPEAREIRCWHSDRIPGTLQSQMYVLAQHESEFAANNAEVTRVLRAWTARTKLFTMENPPRYRAILSESSLRRIRASRATQLGVDQSEHLVKLIDRHQQLELQILLFDAEIDYVDSDFQHLMFDGDRHGEFVYIEYPGASRKCKSEPVLAKCREEWEKLSAAALDLSESREFLNKIAGRDGSSAP